ncbi:MAG: hypothetical protein CUN56_02135 [Phototrophicales bacterium]|nr:MAG: hypothetical protein CUN56_02135 [Phototrophicales bacterium]RMG70155.1 MAG: TIR domain-containing protein [Chloroflexota bacterium]
MLNKTVFISYARADTEFAENVRHRLKDEGFSVWIDREELRPGEDWRTEIDQALRNAFAVVIIVSSASMASQYVLYEWAFAIGAGKLVVPLLYEENLNMEDETNVHPRMTTFQYLDFTNRKTRDWAGLIRVLREEGTHPQAFNNGTHLQDHLEPTLIRRSYREMGEKTEMKNHYYRSYELSIINGAGAGKRYMLDKSVIQIGKDERNDIVLNIRGVSRSHARLIYKHDSTYEIRDMESVNGTYVNRQRLKPGEVCLLHHGDVIGIGTVKGVLEMRFEIMLGVPS